MPRTCSTEELPYCKGVDSNTSVTLNNSEIICGWTSRGIYFVINPSILNKVQMALPFTVLRLIHNHASEETVKQGSPEVDTFLWDGSFDLPTLLINLNLASLSCIPSEDMFNSTLGDLTTFISLANIDKIKKIILLCML